VRRGPYKAHFLIPPPGTELGSAQARAGDPQLYNLDQDPSEKFDVAKQYPEIVAELRRIADEHQKTVKPVKDQIRTRTGTTDQRQ
jgi:arylsulfatase A